MRGYGSVINRDGTTRFQQSTHVQRTPTGHPKIRRRWVIVSCLLTAAFTIFTLLVVNRVIPPIGA